jgi:protein-L-isoaspartate(D-aspartate) O-methyltransferase
MPDFARRRAQMVERQIERRGVRDALVLQAMRAVPRERFVAPFLQEQAYEDTPLSIGEGQTISQPYIVALMVAAATIGRNDHVLEVGAGSGYAAAVMSLLAKRVYAIERRPELARAAAERLRLLGYANIEVKTGDGGAGWPEAAPFDAILIAAGAPAAPETLKRQLKIGGRLVAPVGVDLQDLRLVRLIRTGENVFAEDDFGAVTFVPMIGEQGWPEHVAGR